MPVLLDGEESILEFTNELYFCLLLSDDGEELTVPVLLDGEESILEFMDLQETGVGFVMSNLFVPAFL